MLVPTDEMAGEVSRAVASHIAAGTDDVKMAGVCYTFVSEVTWPVRPITAHF